MALSRGFDREREAKLSASAGPEGRIPLSPYVQLMLS